MSTIKINEIADRRVAYLREVAGPEKTIILNKMDATTVPEAIKKVNQWRTRELSEYAPQKIMTPFEVRETAERHIREITGACGPELTILLNRAQSETVDQAVEKIRAWEQMEYDTHSSMRMKIEKKIEKYRRYDAQLSKNAKRALRPTMTFCEGYKLLVESKGLCAICNKRVKLSGWEPLDIRQFSYDRLNDFDSHNVGNCQITCLACNHEKANKRMKLNLDDLNEYRKLKKKYLFNPDENTREKLMKLHFVLYGNSRPNKWQKKKIHRK